MASGMVGPERERVLRWLEESPAVFAGVRRLLHEYDQATAETAAAQAERLQLQQQYGVLLADQRHLLAERKRLEKERIDSAQWFAAMVLEAAARFPLTPPPG